MWLANLLSCPNIKNEYLDLSLIGPAFTSKS